jgi:beta-N-acetylhexosaminidase
LPDATDTYSADELIPYKKLIDMGIAQVIMSAHIVNKQYDSSGTPATFSKTMIDDKLRKNLGFEGVVVSDALEMGAIQKYLSNELNTSDPQRIFEESMVRALSICDQVLWCKRDSYTPKQAETAILKAIEVGTLTEGNLKSKYEKIINLKKSTTTSIK